MEVYERVGITKDELKKIRKSTRISAQLKSHHSFTSIRDGQKLIACYIKKQVAKGIYPTHREITNDLKLNINTYFKSIKDAYEFANIKYKRDPNPLISLRKEKLLIEISFILFKKFGYKVEINSSGKGPDIILKKIGSTIPVEIKAYHKSISLPNRLPYLQKRYKNEYDQLKSYMKNLQSKKGILVTSTSKISKNPPKNIKVINYDSLVQLLIKYDLLFLKRKIDWIRNTYSSESKEIMINYRRSSIINFVRRNLTKGKLVTTKQIESKFKIDIRTYFNSIKEIYYLAKL